MSCLVSTHALYIYSEALDVFLHYSIVYFGVRKCVYNI